MTAEEQIAVLRAARRSFDEWRERLSAMAKPSSQVSAAVRTISAHLREVDKAVQAASKGKEPANWPEEVAIYRLALQEFRDWLAKFEMTERISYAQMTRQKDHLRAVQSWTKLIRQVV